MQAADVILTILEVEKLVTNAFFDENTASVLLYNGLFVLFHKVNLSSSTNNELAYLENRLFNLLDFARLDRPLRTTSQVL